MRCENRCELNGVFLGPTDGGTLAGKITFVNDTASPFRAIPKEITDCAATPSSEPIEYGGYTYTDPVVACCCVAQF